MYWTKEYGSLQIIKMYDEDCKKICDVGWIKQGTPYEVTEVYLTKNEMIVGIAARSVNYHGLDDFQLIIASKFKWNFN